MEILSKKGDRSYHPTPGERMGHTGISRKTERDLHRVGKPQKQEVASD
jgi:hypothetical protein